MDKVYDISNASTARQKGGSRSLTVLCQETIPNSVGPMFAGSAIQVTFDNPSDADLACTNSDDYEVAATFTIRKKAVTPAAAPAAA